MPRKEDVLASTARSQQDDLCEVVVHATQLLSPHQHAPSDMHMFRTYSRRLLAAPTRSITFVPGPAHGYLAGAPRSKRRAKGVVYADSKEKRDKLVCARTEVTQKRAVGAPPLRRVAAVLCCSRLGWSSYRWRR